MSDEWSEWHRAYASDSHQARRLAYVQADLRAALEALPQGPLRVVSLCSGDGRDLLGVLDGHPRRQEISARLVDLTPSLVEVGRARASKLGLPGVEFVQGDASDTSVLAGAVPADLLLACGIFGNVSDDDVRTTVAHLPELCAAGAFVVWTRGRFEPNLLPSIRRWFEEEGFSERSYVEVPGSTGTVVMHRFEGRPRPFRSDVRLFTFLPPGERPSRAVHPAGSRPPRA